MVGPAERDRLLADVLKRAEEVNSSGKFLYKVVEIILFGSYLDTSRERLGDLDLAVRLEPKEQDRKKHIKACARQADKESNRYLSFLDRHSYFSYAKVFKYLRNRSRGISLHSSTDGIISTGIPTKVVFPIDKQNG